MKQFIKKFYNAFETKTRTNGNEYVILKDKSRAEFKDLVREIHGTDFLPDDFRFKTIESILGSILDSVDFSDVTDSDSLIEALEDKRSEIVDSLVSIPNKDLTEWLDSHLDRAWYVDEAKREYGPTDGLFSDLKMGQYYEIDEIFSRIQGALVDHYETEMVA